MDSNILSACLWAPPTTPQIWDRTHALTDRLAFGGKGGSWSGTRVEKSSRSVSVQRFCLKVKVKGFGFRLRV